MRKTDNLEESNVLIDSNLKANENVEEFFEDEEGNLYSSLYFDIDSEGNLFLKEGCTIREDGSICSEANINNADILSSGMQKAPENDDYYSELEYGLDENGNRYSKSEYGIDRNGDLFFYEDFHVDEEGNIYSKYEYTIGTDGFLYSNEELTVATVSTRPQEESKNKKSDKVAGGMVVRDIEPNLWEKIVDRFKGMEVIEYITMFTGIVVIVGAIIALLTWSHMRDVEDEMQGMRAVGEELASATIYGEVNLGAIKDAYVTRINLEPSDKEKNEEGIQVEVTFTSIEKDLKIKFVDKNTSELIDDVLFKVELIDENDKARTFLDTNKDGIIYESSMAAGKYMVKCINVGGFSFPQDYTAVTVKDKIKYEKIYIADEVKTDDEINEALEDKKDHEEKVENVIKDTVAFVESTKTPITGDEVYTEVSKDTIPDPSLVAFMEGAFLKMTEDAVTGVTVDETASVKVGDTVTLTAIVEPDTATNKGIAWSSSNVAIATVGENGVVTGVSEGKAVITARSHDGSFSDACTVTVSAADVPPLTDILVSSITLSADAGKTTINEKETVQLTATIEPDTATNRGIAWSSSDVGIATVDEDGLVTALEVNEDTTVKITATAADAGAVKGEITITVKNIVEESIAIYEVDEDKVEDDAIALKVNQEKKLDILNNAPSISSPVIKWTSGDASIVTVGLDGTIKGIKEGKAIITANIEGTDIKDTCEVTVGPAVKLTIPEKLEVKQGESLEIEVKTDGLADEIEWESANEKIATVAKNSTTKKYEVTVLVTTKPGDKVVITATLDGVSVKCEVIVMLNPKYDTKTELKDKNGVGIYVLVGEEYRLATHADYFDGKITKFYIKGNNQYKYTGWQTIGTKTYYYDVNYKKVTGEQVIQGVKYNFGSDGALSMQGGSFGIDVSKWNRTIDWKAVKNSGVSYAIIRCGFRGYSTGVLVEDANFYKYIEGATAAGIKVGVYFYSQAINEVEAVQEASMVLGMIDDYNITYPVFIDIEKSTGRADKIDKQTRTNVARAFCETIKNSGYTPGVYANKDWFTNKINTSQLSAYKLWLAQYNTTVTYNGRYDMWQYTESGRVGGISTNVDLNKSYLGY